MRRGQDRDIACHERRCGGSGRAKGGALVRLPQSPGFRRRLQLQCDLKKIAVKLVLPAAPGKLVSLLEQIPETGFSHGEGSFEQGLRLCLLAQAKVGLAKGFEILRLKAPRTGCFDSMAEGSQESDSALRVPKAYLDLRTFHRNLCFAKRDIAVTGKGTEVRRGAPQGLSRRSIIARPFLGA